VNGGRPPASDQTAPPGAVPPPGDALLAEVAAMKPVRTRSPGRSLARLATAGLAVSAIAVAAGGVRHDLDALLAPWVLVLAVVFAAGAAAPLVLAVLPPRGAVLPDTARVGRAAGAVSILLLLVGFLAAPEAPGRTVMPTGAAAFRMAWLHCAGMGMAVALPLVVLACFAMRRLLPVGETRVAAAIGATGGAFGALALLFACPMGGGLHVGLAHAGGVVLSAAAAALLLPRFLRA